MTIDCPHCQAPLLVPQEASGRRAKCSECTGRFVIPSPRDLLDETVSHWMAESFSSERLREDEESGEAGGSTGGGEMHVATAADDDPLGIGEGVDGGGDGGDAGGTVAGIAVGREVDPKGRPEEDRTVWRDNMSEPRDAAAGTPPKAAPAGKAGAPTPGEATYPTQIDPVKARPYLAVREVTMEGVTLAFDSRWLRDERFRASLPMRCVFTGEAAAGGSLMVRPVVFADRYRGPEMSTRSLEHKRERRLGRGTDRHAAVKSIGSMDGFARPFDQTLAYYASDRSDDHTLDAWTKEQAGGKVACEVRVPHGEVALQWLERVNGCVGPEHALLSRDIQRLSDDRWTSLADKTRKRIEAWARFGRGESFALYLNDPDLPSTDAGLAGVLVTDQRLVYHKYRKQRSVCLNQDAVLHVRKDGAVARLAIESMGRIGRAGKIHSKDIPRLVEALASAPRLRVQVGRRSEESG
jgi:hypothetical protein